MAPAATSYGVARYVREHEPHGLEESIPRWIRRWKGDGIIARIQTPRMVCSDQRGQQFLEACRRAQVHVPDELAVVSVDNDEPLCEVCLPTLSSIDPGHANVGYQAAALLDSILKGVSSPKTPVLLKPNETVTPLSSDVLAVADPATSKALRLIREQAHLRVCIDSIAREVGLSRSVLQRRFRALLNRSIHQELLNARIKCARKLLTKTDLPLAAVAERSGFGAQEYLGAVFKKHLGKTPARARAESR